MIEAKTPLEFPRVHARGSHYEIGRAHGAACARQIPEFVNRGLAWLNHYQPMPRAQALARAREYLPHARAFAPHLVEEWQGVADGAGVPFDEIVFLHVRTLMLYTGRPECSAFAVRPPATADGSVFIGQNHDWDPGGQQYGILLHLEPKDKPPVLMFTYTGQIGFIGMNGAGLGLCMNLLLSPGWRAAVPHYLIIRRIFEQTSVRDAVEVIASATRSSSANFLLADRETSLDVETTPYEHAVLQDEDGILVHTNHFRSEALIPQERLLAELPDSPARCATAVSNLRQRTGQIDRAALEDLLRNHEGYPYSVCRHPTEAANSLETVVGFLAEPTAGQVHIARGTPCQSQFVTYRV